MKLSLHQTKLLALIKEHQPVVVVSSPWVSGWPVRMLDGKVWAAGGARAALYEKGLIRYVGDTHFMEVA